MSGLFQDDPAEQDDIPPPPPEGPGLFGDALPATLTAAVAEPVQASPYRVLARKYRPTTFDDLIGQEAMVRILRNAFAIGRVAHAFMLTGVRGVGKTTTARIIARALNCIGPDGTGGPTADPCGVCANCVGILADRHPDVVEMDAASRNGIGDIRELIESVRFRPMQARNKVFILDEVHMLTNQAFNALLKTLEEPPPHVKFIFATTELRKVPITVLSRCQRFDLRRVRIAELSQHYGRIAEQEAVVIEPAALAQIARAADGSVRDGLSILDQAIAQVDSAAASLITAEQVADMLGLADREAVFDLMDAVMAGKPATALAVTDAAYERGADLGTLLQDLLDLLHTVTRLKSIPGLRDSQDMPEAERTRGAQLADQLSVPVLARSWQMLLKGVGEVEAAPDRRAAAEMVLIRLCHVADMPTPADLVRRLGGGGPVGGGPVGGGMSAVAASTSGSSAPAGARVPAAPGDGSLVSAPASAAELLPASAVAPSGATAASSTSAGVAPSPAAGAALPAAPAGAVLPAAPAGAVLSAASAGAVLPAASAVAALPAAPAVATLPAGPAMAASPPGPAVALSPSAGDGGRAVANGAPVLAVEAAPAVPRLNTFRDIAALVSAHKAAVLHAHLLHSVHLVRFAPPVIELRPQPSAPRDLAPKLAALLAEATGTRWTIALSTAAGEPTLADQGSAADTARRSAAADHPLVRAILDTFPGARIDSVNDRTTDAYGLPAAVTEEPDMPAFAPPDAAYFDEDPMEIDP